VPAGCIFTASRLDAPKRMHWVIQAYQQARLTCPLVIAGDGPQRPQLEALANGNPHIHLVGRLTDAELASAYQQALFVPFVPDREDYGLITLEALQAGKPVLTCADTGGVTELVQHEVNGLITSPTIEALAAGMRRLATDTALLEKLSAQAMQSVAHIQWDALSHAFCTPSPKVAVVNTFSIYPATGGGQIRMLNIYSEMARRFSVRMVNLSHSASDQCTRTLAPGLQEIVVPMTPEHREFEARLGEELRASCVDIAAMLKPELTPEWLAEIKAACEWADIVIASHPYGYPAIRQVWQGPVVYEGHNVEADLKQAIFGHAKDTLAKVHAVEAECAKQAPLVLCCSADDAARMQQLFDLPAMPTVVPNGVAVRAYARTTDVQRAALRQRLGLGDQPVALFVGSLHGPNIDAAQALLSIAPHCPEVVFVVVGSVCDSQLLRATTSISANVRLVGRVSDAELRVWLAVASVGVNPMVSGSGTNLKMLEFAAAGLPMLSTPFGGRGGVFTQQEHYIAAEISEFAEALQSMMQPQNKVITAARAESAYQAVLSGGDWRNIAGNLAGKIGELLLQSYEI
jgi:glycosyltransferase involved in cell wall biosynthesis